MSNHRFGRIHKPDARDRRYPMQLLLPAQVLPGIRHYQPGPTLDQGDTGTCVAHGWCGWAYGAPLMTKRDAFPAPFDLYRAIVAIDEFEDNDAEATATDPEDLQYGTTVRAGVDLLRSKGHVKNYVWARSAEDVRRYHLSGQGVVVLGVNWYAGMMEPDRKEFIHVRGPVAGGHCVKSTGWNDFIVPGGALRIQNNWGRAWGNLGRAWISYADLDRLIAEDGEACAATQQPVTPLPA